MSTSPRKVVELRTMRAAVHLEMTSDFVCPWCFIGERRLRKALASVPDIEVKLTWRPFQLNAWIPPQGMSRRDYRVLKFGSWEESLRMDAEVVNAGRAEGLEFNFDKVHRIANTFDLHRLMQLAQKEADPHELAVRLMEGYFSHGTDLSDRLEVIAIATRAGLPEKHVVEVLESASFAAEVRALETATRISGTYGIPEFRLGDTRLTGAKPVASLVAAIRAAATKQLRV
jgi:predicted DsbA family dithiol-disulfide isomerase